MASSYGLWKTANDGGPDYTVNPRGFAFANYRELPVDPWKVRSVARSYLGVIVEISGHPKLNRNQDDEI